MLSKRRGGIGQSGEAYVRVPVRRNSYIVRSGASEARDVMLQCVMCNLQTASKTAKREDTTPRYGRKH